MLVLCKRMECLQKSFENISIKNETEKKYSENKYVNSPEWKRIIDIAKTHDLRLALTVITEFSKSFPDVTLDNVEIALRQINGSRVWLFAEDPKMSKWAASGNTQHMNGKASRYVFSLSTKISREEAKMDFDPGCRDEKENLIRLKDAGYSVPPVFGKGNLRMTISLLESLINKEEGIFQIESEETFVTLVNLIHSNRDVKRLLVKVKIPIVYEADITYVLNPWVLNKKKKRIVEVVE